MCNIVILSRGDISLARLMFRMFTQFHNFMEVTILYFTLFFPLKNLKERAKMNESEVVTNYLQYKFFELLSLYKSIKHLLYVHINNMY